MGEAVKGVKAMCVGLMIGKQWEGWWFVLVLRYRSSLKRV